MHSLECSTGGGIGPGGSPPARHAPGSVGFIDGRMSAINATNEVVLPTEVSRPTGADT